ncbi:MAG TPA: GNAT family protein [Candidatus Limiplasma sp.]|nr:GNAT family protein [Candidatus Limiplasma sp.]HPS81327.1 GNAT family protein [Candidatus Limiplasma sp.]
MPRLFGNQILLREYRSEDIAGIRSWSNDQETVRYLSARYWMPQSYADAADFLEHATHAASNGAFFVIAALEDEAYLGQIDLYTINWKLRSAEMAIVLGAEARRGQGIGTQAIGLVLEYAFLTLGLERVELDVATENKRAIRCYEKSGFVLEGVKRHAFMLDGEYTDLAVMSVLSGEWRARRKAAQA